MVEIIEQIKEFVQNILNKLDEIKPREVQVVEVRQNPDSFSYSELEKGKTSDTRQQTKDNPILEFENKLFTSSIVKSISLRPDTTFKTNGKIRITVDDSEVFISKKFNAFEDVTDLLIKVNKTIEQDSKVKVFMNTNAGEIGMTVIVQFGG